MPPSTSRSLHNKAYNTYDPFFRSQTAPHPPARPLHPRPPRLDRSEGRRAPSHHLGSSALRLGYPRRGGHRGPGPRILGEPHNRRASAPFRWDEDRRACLRAEIDAIYAHLYGLGREDIEYILDAFPIVKRKDVERYGTYGTKEMILRYYEEYAGMLNKTDEAAFE